MFENIIKFCIRYFFYILSFVFFLLLNIFIYRSLLLNLSTNLLDWNDYPLFVWIMQHNIDNLQQLKFNGFFDTNIFYPFQGNLLFSDLFLPTSIIGYFVQIFVKSPMTTFNVVFFLVLAINPISCLFFWKNFFTSKWIIFFATLTTAFSPFVILNSYHFQMLNIWPLFFCLGFLLRKELSFKNAVFGGIFLTLQFLSGVYYAIFALFIIGIWYLIKCWEVKDSPAKIFYILRKLSVFMLTFLILSGFFISKYIQVKNAYDITREYWEYVIYASHPSDYLFFPYRSILDGTSLFMRWNAFNNHWSSAGFPGFVLLIFSVIGIFSYQRIYQVRTVVLKLSSHNLFFLILLICGFIFSLGPRLSVNGVYLGIPLPYSIVLKLMPFFEPIRADSRWSFLFYFSLTFFACLGIQKIMKSIKKEIIIILVLSIFYIIEIIPTNRNTESKEYYNSIYNIVKGQCIINKQVMLEYPLTQDKKDANIVTNLSYKTQMLMASLTHKCNIVNGYSGYTPEAYESYETELYIVIPTGGKDKFYQLLKLRNVNLFKLNKKEIYEEKAQVIEAWLKDKSRYVILEGNEDYVIAKLL